MLIGQQAFDTVPREGSETISSTPGSRRGNADASSSQPFPRELGAACETPELFPKGKRREGGRPGAAHQPGNASLDIPSLLERAGGQTPRGVSLSRDWHSQSYRGEAGYVPKFKWPLDLVQSLHSTGFHGNSKGTNDRER